MKFNRIFLFLISIFFFLFGYGQDNLNTTNFEKYYFGLVNQVIDADDFFLYKGGYILLRKEDRYSVISQYGTVVIPEGKYMLNMRPEEDIRNRFNPFALVVRDPQTGLYGLFNLYDEIEIVPCKYNELTPFYGNVDLAIGTYHDLKNNQKKKYYINTAGEEFPFYNFTLGSAESDYSRYVKILGGSEEATALKLEANKQYIYDIWDGKVTASFDKPIRFQYYGSNLFIINESFNGLQKYAFMNHKGEIVIPFKDYTGLVGIKPFQRADPKRFNVIPKNVALLQGNRSHFFSCAILEETGEISSMLKTGEGFSSIGIVDRGEVLGGKVLISAQKQGESISDLYLWDLFEDRKLTSIRELFLRNFINPYLPLKEEKPEFRFRGRNGKSILFGARIVYAHHKELFDLFPMAIDLAASGGVSLKNEPKSVGKFGYVVEGYGLMDEETGVMTIPPVFSTLGIPDAHSGLAYAEMVYNNIRYRGIIQTGSELLPGSFVFLFK